MNNSFSTCIPTTSSFSGPSLPSFSKNRSFTCLNRHLRHHRRRHKLEVSPLSRLIPAHTLPSIIHLLSLLSLTSPFSFPTPHHYRFMLHYLILLHSIHPSSESSAFPPTDYSSSSRTQPPPPTHLPPVFPLSTNVGTHSPIMTSLGVYNSLLVQSITHLS